MTEGPELTLETLQKVQLSLEALDGPGSALVEGGGRRKKELSEDGA